MRSEIIVNSEPQETRVALLEDGQVAEFYIERARDRGIVGNIYKGQVTKVLPGMQAAFVDIGLEKAGFLYVDEVDTIESIKAYQRQVSGEEAEIEFEGGKETRRRHNHERPIEQMLREGQEVLVQVSKEPMGNKGCRLTSYITLPGRYVVLMPTIDQVGISRRIEDENERRRLKQLVRRMKGAGVGVIVRTVSEGMDSAELEGDVQFRARLCHRVVVRRVAARAPALLHYDLHLIHRAIRDLMNQEVECLRIDSRQAYQECREFVATFYPHLLDKVVLYGEREPIFDACGVELELERALGRRVWLKSGGHIVIDQTEALVTIDVNTGRFVGRRNPEETILKANLEAAREIVSQIRLRNIGGIIIVDFIDMEREENRERVFEFFKDELRKDRSRTNILKISELGLVEMTRKRVRESLTRTLTQACPYCEGRAVTKSPTSVTYEVLREIRRVWARNPDTPKALATVHPQVADLLLDEEAPYVEALERELGLKVVIKADPELHQEGYEVVGF
ncbi:MAG: ribonuclease E/G [Nitrospinota bacterium]